MDQVKRIPGTTEYQVSIDGKLVLKDGVACTLPAINGLVEIEMYGVVRRVDPQWLGLIAHFECELPADSLDRLWSVWFADTDHTVCKNPSRKIMVLKKTIVFWKDYRIVPGFVRYAVSKEGALIDTHTHRKISPVKGPLDDYRHVSIYDADRGKYTYVPLHRLVALAWIANDDYLGKPVVNHKDGNKGNYRASNLEWVSRSGNCKHAVVAGLRYDNKKCRVRDMVEKKVYDFFSLRDAIKFMGFAKDTKVSQLQSGGPGRLLAGRYELRVEGDERPWFYENRDTPVGSSRYELRVSMPDGTEETWYDARKFLKHYKCWNVGGNVKDIVAKAIALNPGMQVEVIDHYTVPRGLIESRCLETGEVIEARSFREMGLKTGNPHGIIRNAVSYDGRWILNGRVYRHKTDAPWPTDYIENRYKPKCILAVHQITGERKEFTSLRQAEKFFGYSRPTLSKVVNADRTLKNWKLTESESSKF